MIEWKTLGVRVLFSTLVAATTTVCSTNKEPEQEPTAKTQAPVLVMVGCESYTNYRGDSCGICFYNDTDYSFQDYLNGASLTFEDFCD